MRKGDLQIIIKANFRGDPKIRASLETNQNYIGQKVVKEKALENRHSGKKSNSKLILFSFFFNCE